MYHLANDLFENITYAADFETDQSNFYMSFSDFPGPDDEDEEEGDDDSGAGDDDPPIDDDVVHSPAPPQTGGRPKKA